MSKVIELVVVQSNPTTKDTFITKLEHKTTVDLGVLGKKDKKETFYISSKGKPATGEIIKLDMDMFNVVERPFDHPEEGEIMLKWLHLR